jgi:hypothetical protein
MLYRQTVTYVTQSQNAYYTILRLFYTIGLKINVFEILNNSSL